MKFYKDEKDKLGSFYFKRPLWIFVGNSVSGGKKDKFDKKTLSDLQFVITFFDKFLKEKDEFVEKFSDIFNDKLTLKGKDEDIVLSKIFNFLKKKSIGPKSLYEDILNVVFNADSSGKLELWEIKSASGEAALKVSTAEKYFALVYIGDVNSFKKKLEEDNNQEFGNDNFNNPFFKDIDEDYSPINILMGSKKFIEGWNSFRVSTMGLLKYG